jgi:hypothetical protein
LSASAKQPVERRNTEQARLDVSKLPDDTLFRDIYGKGISLKLSRLSFFECSWDGY